MSIASGQRKTFSGKGGRSPRAGVERYPSGQIVHRDRKPAETEEQARATVVAQRVKLFGVKPAKATDDRLGYALGRLWLEGTITKAQHEAGLRFARVVRDSCSLEGFASPFPKSGSVLERIAGVAGDPLDPDAPGIDADEAKRRLKVIGSIRGSYADAYSAIADMERSGTYRGTWRALRAVCLEDADISRDMMAVGNLRSGLNVLARMWGM